MATKEKFISIFESCLNILRNNEFITGKIALKNISYLLVLKLIEPKLEEIKIDEYDYDFSHIKQDQIKKHKIKLLKLVRFSNLIENIKDLDDIKDMWKYILSSHPITKNIFLENKNFDIKKETTFKKLINKLNEFEFNNDFDLLGEAYENLIKDIMTGKVLGQFFTNPIIKDIMIELIDPKIKPNGEIESCADPAAGTGGFLTSYMKYIINKAKKENINLNLDLIKDGIYGKEIEPTTYQLAYSNMIINNYDFTLEKGDSIRDQPTSTKFDNILANPPFGINGLDYEEFDYPNKKEYLPIKSNNAVSLFIQAIIYMLKINGKCAIVLPNGKDLCGENNKLISIRKYLMRTCKLKQVIYLPSGLFNNTSVDTCILYFIKKREIPKVINLKTNKFKKIELNYNVKFYKYEEDKTKTLLVKVPIKEIQNNNYVLNYESYLNEEEIKYENGTELKSLNEICELISGKKINSKLGKKEGLYPLYYCSILGNLYIDDFTYEGEGLIINKTNGAGKAMIYYNTDKYNVGNTTIHFRSKTETVLNEYLYYYFLNNLEVLQKYYTGANQKSITNKNLLSIKIPIPTLERQEELIEIYKKHELEIKELEEELKNLENQKIEIRDIINSYLFI